MCSWIDNLIWDYSVGSETSTDCACVLFNHTFFHVLCIFFWQNFAPLRSVCHLTLQSKSVSLQLLIFLKAKISCWNPKNEIKQCIEVTDGYPKRTFAGCFEEGKCCWDVRLLCEGYWYLAIQHYLPHAWAFITRIFLRMVATCPTGLKIRLFKEWTFLWVSTGLHSYACSQGFLDWNQWAKDSVFTWWNQQPHVYDQNEPTSWWTLWFDLERYWFFQVYLSKTCHTWNVYFSSLQLTYAERTGQLLSCAATLWPYPIIELMMWMWG